MTGPPFSGRRILVVGIGESGHAAAVVLARLGARVKAVDASGCPQKVDGVKELRSCGVEVQLGVSVPDDICEFELLVTSPGVPDDAGVLLEARRVGIDVISELEVGFRLLDNEMIAVTGTNGKTTTTKIIASVMDRPERKVHSCGNIGNPLTAMYGKVGPTDLLVVEVSSFQLKNIKDFRAHVSVVLNVTHDHLDWHRDIEDYRMAKLRLVENQLPDDFLVYNLDDDFCREMAGATAARTVGFSTVGAPGKGLWVERGWIRTGAPFEESRLMPVDEIRIPGAHNVENVMAACSAALVLGEDPVVIRERVGRFKGLEHRMEFAGRIGDVSFYNDSKATNPHAASKALLSFSEPSVVIMGGRNKGLRFNELAEVVCRKLEGGQLDGVVLLGESAADIMGSIEECCPSIARERVLTAYSIKESIEKALNLCRGAKIVLFSPACASFDMFRDYRERGRVFKETVKQLGGK